MHVIDVLIRAALAATLGAAAVAKLRDRNTVGRLAAAAAPVELVVAVALLAAPPAAGALAALGLVAVFDAVLLVRIVRGDRRPCNCFGRRAVRPLGWQVLTRNAVLSAGAVAIWSFAR
jgi:hypothetical protein